MKAKEKKRQSKENRGDRYLEMKASTKDKCRLIGKKKRKRVNKKELGPIESN